MRFRHATDHDGPRHVVPPELADPPARPGDADVIERVHLVRQRLIHVAGEAHADDGQALLSGPGGDQERQPAPSGNQANDIGMVGNVVTC